MRQSTTVGRLVLAAATGVVLVAAAARAQEWTRFRGPNGTGHGTGQAIPVQWTKEDYNWKVKLPGGGHGSPVLWGRKVFLLCCDQRTAGRVVVCVSAADGSIAWRRPYHTSPFRMNSLNSYAGSTPAVDKDRVYVCWTSRKEFLVVALDHGGKEIWRRDLGPHESQHGPCTSPVVFEDLVIVQNDQQGDSFLLAVDSATGKTRWKLPRKSGRAAYGTPCIFRPKGKAPQLILTSTASGVTSVNPATGTVNWQRADTFSQRCVGSPATGADLVFASCGTGSRGIRFVAVRPPSAGKPAEIAYDLKRHSPYVPTPLVKGDLLFLISDTGTLTCLRASTGEQLWQQRSGVGGGFYSSPVCVGDRIYFISRKGEVLVVAAAEKYKLLARNSLGEMCYTTPAIAGGKMYIRTYRHLVCLGGGK